MAEPVAFTDVSDALSRLADLLRRDGNTGGADSLVDAAARVELLSDELQNCWGGPFNGQEGRQRLAAELLDKMRPETIVETGTFRGITTEWFATHFSEPILSCDIERKYLLQAEHRLRPFDYVSLSLADSRSFLREVVNRLPASSRVLFYLDAHWKDDLPLFDELSIIMGSGLQWVVMIDDFKVPFDEGYGFDDYGPGKVLCLELLSILKDGNCKIFFPRLHSSEETGAVRGTCVLTSSMVDELLACSLLRSGDWKDWRLEELEARAAQLQAGQNGGQEVEGCSPGSADRENDLDILVPGRASDGTPLQTRLEDWGRKFDQHLSQADHRYALLQERLAEWDKRFEQHFEQAERQHAYFQEQLEEWGLKFDHYLGQADERTELGRLLVEERANKLDLQRQLHRLEISLEMAQHGHLPEQEALRDLIARSYETVRSLGRSRALLVLSLFAPRPIRTATQARQLLERVMRMLDGPPTVS